MQSEYTVSEFNQFVMVCVEVKRGSLGVPISLSLATHDVTAQGNQILWAERQIRVQLYHIINVTCTSTCTC